jgi:hypothetical protein
MFIGAAIWFLPRMLLKIASSSASGNGREDKSPNPEKTLANRRHAGAMSEGKKASLDDHRCRKSSSGGPRRREVKMKIRVTLETDIPSLSSLLSFL